MIIFGRCSLASRVIVAPDAIRDDLVQLAREVQRMAVRQVAAVREVHPEDRVAGREQREVGGHVGLRARMGLHVGMFGAEQRPRAGDRQRLDLVVPLTAAVVATARVALGVLVGEDGACRLHDRFADEVLRRDQFQPVVLACSLAGERAGNVRINGGQRAEA
jgi:hypothetical protein